MKIRRTLDTRGQASDPTPDVGREFVVIGLVVLIRPSDPLAYFIYCGNKFYYRLPDMKFPDYAKVEEAEIVSEEIPSHWICRSFMLLKQTTCIVMSAPDLCDPHVMEKLIDADNGTLKAFTDELIRLSVPSTWS